MKKQRRIGGATVAIPTEVLDELRRRKTSKGSLATLAHQAGIRPGIVQATVRLKKRTMNQHFLERIQRALAGEQLSPLNGMKHSLVRLPTMPGVVVEAAPAAITMETKALMDGVLLGVEVLRRAVLTRAGL